MNQIQQNSAPKKRVAGIAAAIVLILTVGFFVSPGSEAEPPPPVGNEGPWILAAPSYNCQAPNDVCAEWPYYDTNTAEVCCIDRELEGAYVGPGEVGEICHENFGMRAF